MNTLIKVTAVRQWAGGTREQKAIVRLGMIPIEWHREALASIGKYPDLTRLHTLALMDCAKHDGGMVA